jgi:hypothetical protein
MDEPKHFESPIPKPGASQLNQLKMRLELARMALKRAMNPGTNTLAIKVAERDVRELERQIAATNLKDDQWLD